MLTHACDQKKQSSIGESYLYSFGPVAYDYLIQCENKYRCLCVWGIAAPRMRS